MRSILFISLFLFSGVSFGQTAREHYNSALAAFEKEEYQSGLKIIEKALRLDSTVADFWILKAVCYEKLDFFQESYNTYSTAIEKIQDNSSLYTNRGNLLLNLKEFDLAIQDFSSAIDFSEDDTSKYISLTNRAAAKMGKRDFEGAYLDLLLAYNFDSTDVATLTNLGAVCDEIGKGDETLTYLFKAIEVDSTYYPAYGNIGFKYQEMGQHAKAIEYYNKVLEFEPDAPLGYSNRAFNKYKLGDLAGAMNDINKSISLFAANAYAYRIRALIFLQLNDTKNACKDLNFALEKGYTTTFGDEVLNLVKEHCKE